MNRKAPSTIGTLLAEMNQVPVEVWPDSAIQHTAETLASNNIGVAVVIDGERRVVGIVSERDVVRAYVKLGPAMGATPVNKIMSRDIVCCAPTDSISHSIKQMLDNRIRHLPVMDGDAFLGIVSIRDLLSAWIKKDVEDRSSLAQLVEALVEVRVDGDRPAEPEKAAAAG